MKRKTCMCGYSTDKASKWDDDLDQCKVCSKEQAKKMQKMQNVREYLSTFEVGELVCWRSRLHLLIEKEPLPTGAWRLLDPTTGIIHRMFVRNWIYYSDCPDIREIIMKWTETDHS